MYLTRVGKTIAGRYILMVRGKPVGVAAGESNYQPNNPRMSYATAAESMKSNALVRCCKDLGMGSECWDRNFTDTWKQKNAHRKREKNWKGEDVTVWRRKEFTPGVKTSDEGAPPVPQGSGVPMWFPSSIVAIPSSWYWTASTP